MNILTFDIEDWWVYKHYSIGKEAQYLPRLNGYLDEILDLLDIRNFKATFFCLGDVANNYPNVLKKIASKGHHIGCHSYSHHFFKNDDWDFVEHDTCRALDIIENIIGEKVTAYRAPAFSITEDNIWILEILAQNGITQDCSIFPANRSFGGFSSFEFNAPSIIQVNSLTIKEFPISVTPIFGRNVAYSGGGYFRLFPYWKLKSIVRNSNYVMTYFHIKDFDCNQIKMFMNLEGETALIRYIKNYLGLKGNFAKFKMFLDDFSFESVQQADLMINWNAVPKINFNLTNKMKL